ncbi:MAG: hypothetical protein WC928_02915 [Patescibacteria group bacterium]|jgi:isocitrate lyase
MKINKKFLILFLLLVVLILSFFIFVNYKKNINKDLVSSSGKNNVEAEKSFEEREAIIKEELSKKFSVSSDKITVLIGRESEKHISGLFSVKDFRELAIFSGVFYAKVSQEIEIIWAGDGSPDCENIKKEGFSQEMAPNCF